jgi:hypothetical protein
MSQTMKRILFSAMAVLVLLSACGPTAPAPAPTQDPALVNQLIEQSVQLTVAAQNLETAQAQAEFTATPLPTETTLPPTAEPALPTATPFVVVPPTTVSSGGGGGGTTIKPEYACDIIRQRPFDYEEFAKGDDFDVRWTFVNTGTKSWRAGTDLKYSNGPKFTTVSLIELPEIDPGEQYEVVLDATAPTEAGNHLMVWSLEGIRCTPYVAIVVK